MGRRRDLSGQKFNRLLVLCDSGKRNKDRYAIIWLCLCDCGNYTEVRSDAIVSGNIKSCGCYNKENQKKRLTKHDMSRTSTNQCWRDIKQRCYNSHNNSYKNYGGRGIFVCRRWRQSFKNFLSDMGEKPNNLTIERIDNSGPYGKWNCRWSDRRKQARNRRTTKTSKTDMENIKSLIKEGKHTLKEIAKMYGLHPSYISNIKNGRKGVKND